MIRSANSRASAAHSPGHHHRSLAASDAQRRQAKRWVDKCDPIRQLRMMNELASERGYLKKVLCFATYPIDIPRYGGQIRSAEIFNCLCEAYFKVAHYAIFDRFGHPDTKPSEYSSPLSSEDLEFIASIGGRTDVDACTPFLKDARRLRLVLETIRKYAPDVILLQQPWLWPIVKLHATSEAFAGTLIYSSHNHEVPMLEGIVGADKTELVERARQIEDDLLRHCDGMICVSRYDAEALRLRGPSRVLIAANGVRSRNIPVEGEASRLGEISSYRFLLYIASAHRPNIDGFLRLVAPAARHLNSDERIVVVGSVCNAVPSDEKGIHLAGQLSEAELTTLIRRCAGLVLPILGGGGTNLKTAEALYSQKPVIATGFAMRGFERYSKSPRVHIADDETGFAAHCLSVIRLPNEQRSVSFHEEMALEELTWQQTLRLVGSFVGICHASPKSVRKRQQRTYTGAELAAVALEGWHPYEELTQAVWSRSPTAVLAFPVRATAIALMIKAYNPGHRSRTIIFSSFRRFIQAYDLNDEQSASVRLHIQPDDYDNQGRLKIFISDPELHSPSEFGSADSRTLGIQLLQVHIF